MRNKQNNKENNCYNTKMKEMRLEMILFICKENPVIFEFGRETNIFLILTDIFNQILFLFIIGNIISCTWQAPDPSKVNNFSFRCK